MTAISFADLFCGAGLMGAGFVQQGFEPTIAIDVDKHAVATYNRNHKAVAKTGDVSNIPSDIKVDVVVAGPPCQGFSTLGRRDPKDARNSLSLLVYEWAIQTRADVAVIENVPPYLDSVQFKEVHRRFEMAGFTVTSFVLHATDFGAPQRRERCFVVASRRGAIPPPKPTQKLPVTVRETFIGLNKYTDDAMHVVTPLTDLAAERIRYVPPGGDKRDIVAQAPHLCPPSWFKIGCQATDIWGRMLWDEPANTLRCCFYNPSKGRYLHPEENRVLTLREGARLQGVPDEWQFEGPRTVVCRQIGNGVPIPLAAAVANRLNS